jgi:hypothetical protein
LWRIGGLMEDLRFEWRKIKTWVRQRRPESCSQPPQLTRMDWPSRGYRKTTIASSTREEEILVDREDEAELENAVEAGLGNGKLGTAEVEAVVLVVSKMTGESWNLRQHMRKSSDHL